LNANRNAFPSVYHGVVILWMTEHFAEVLHRGAPDFFSIRSGLYQFNAQAPPPGLSAEWESDGLPLIDTRLSNAQTERINRIQSMINELRNSTEAVDLASLGRLYTSLGDVYSNHGASLQALETWNEADRLYTRINSDQGQAEVLLRRAQFYFRVGKSEDARTALDRAEVLFEQSDFPEGRGNVAHSRGALNFLEGRNQEALKAWEEADQYFQQSGNPQGRGNVSRSRGDLHFREGRNHAAQKAWEEADQYFLQSGDPQGRGIVAQSRGDLHFQEGRNQEAQAEWHAATTYYRQCNHRHNLELVQNRLRQLGIEESDSPED
jgi:tetratricopeptide (TPR) repeat protein